MKEAFEKQKVRSEPGDMEDSMYFPGQEGIERIGISHESEISYRSSGSPVFGTPFVHCSVTEIKREPVHVGAILTDERRRLYNDEKRSTATSG